MDGNRRDAGGSGPRDARIRELRAAIDAGSYRADPEAVAESLLGWIADPNQFDRSGAQGPVPVLSMSQSRMSFTSTSLTSTSQISTS